MFDDNDSFTLTPYEARDDLFEYPIDDEYERALGAVLDEALMPLPYYREPSACTSALKMMGWREATSSREKDRWKERARLRVDRDKLWNGIGYIAKPFACFYRPFWFYDDVLLNIGEPFKIPLNAPARRAALRQARSRLPYMAANGRSPHRQALHAIEGFDLEQHVRSEFSRLWPGLVIPPRNDAIPSRPAPEDFRLRLPGLKMCELTVDVAKGGAQGEGIYAKASVNIRIAASLGGGGIEMVGWRHGDREDVYKPMARLYVLMNCAQSAEGMLMYWACLDEELMRTRVTKRDDLLV